MVEDSSLSLKDKEKLRGDGWTPFKPSSESSSIGWWWQLVYVSDPENYYGQKHLEEYTVTHMDNQGNLVEEKKKMLITGVAIYLVVDCPENLG